MTLPNLRDRCLQLPTERISGDGPDKPTVTIRCKQETKSHVMARLNVTNAHFLQTMDQNFVDPSDHLPNSMCGIYSYVIPPLPFILTDRC